MIIRILYGGLRNKHRWYLKDMTMQLIELEVLTSKNLYQLHKMGILIYGQVKRKNLFINMPMHIIVGLSL